MKPLRNELNEFNARQHTLITTEKPDMAAINKNLEKIGDVKTEMAKLQAKHRLEMRAQLSDEQKLKFDNFMHMMKMHESRKGLNQPGVHRRMK